MSGWALLVPAGVDPAPIIASADVEVTTIVREPWAALALLHAGAVAGVLVGDLTDVIPPGVRSYRPDPVPGTGRRPVVRRPRWLTTT